LFVDLLPDGWSTLPPGLPRDVIDELARRAREAEKKLRQQRNTARQEQQAPIRVRVVSQPTFMRYVFELPELVGVSADNGKDKLTLTFDAMLKFDLADAKATLPPLIQAIDSELEQAAVVVRFSFGGKVDVRTFREDNSYVVDISSPDARAARRDGWVRSDELGELGGELSRKPVAAGADPPQTVPSRQAPAPAPPPERRAPAPPQREAPALPAPPTKPATPAKAPAQPPAAPAVVPIADRATTEPAAEVNRPQPPGEDGVVNVAVKRQGEALTLVFPFAEATSAAVFHRADSLWVVFDTNAPIGLRPSERALAGMVRNVTLTRLPNVAIVRLKLERPRLTSVAADGANWTITLANEVVEPTRPLSVSRNIIAPARANVSIAIDDPRQLHRLTDPDAGDTLMVVTAPAPARGLPKTQDFVEFRALASSHGVVLQSLADDLNADLAADKVVLMRPGGLTLSATNNNTTTSPETPSYGRQVLDVQSWGSDRHADFIERKSQLIEAAAGAPELKRLAARADLARFFLARDMAVEAKAVLDVVLAANPPGADDSSPQVLHAVACILSGRPEQALKELASPTVGDQHDAPLWRSLAFARLNKWTDAREGFRNVEAAIGLLPIEMQRLLMKEMVRALIETGDITGAVNQMHEFEAIGVPRELAPAMSVLAGRLAEGLGRQQDALRAYATSADSWDRPAAAQGRLREIVLRRTLGDINREDAISKLETLTTIWRGDETEIEALQLLTRLYTEEGVYRSAFHVMRTALKAHPNSELTRRIQDEAVATFDSLFLAGKGDALPAIDALALFYDFRELTPIGRRGDEMIRRLADRLIAVDLLDQAAELLQHQVDHRLQGAARAQVAARLAVIYLTNRKADKALATLRTSRISDLSNELRNQRLLIEARALSDTGRHDVAIEVIGNIAGREAMRLRSDILWAGKRWNEAAEQIELIYGDRWQEFEPLTDTERADIMRAAIGFALGEDAIGLMRFREKYGAKVGDGPDRRAFEVITAPILTNAAEFREVARAIAAVDTLDAFLRDLRARYPETGAQPTAAAPVPTAPAAKADPPTTGTLRPPVARAARAR
jgi:tetratricopeptide (TPR) repeat protein